MKLNIVIDKVIDFAGKTNLSDYIDVTRVGSALSKVSDYEQWTGRNGDPYLTLQCSANKLFKKATIVLDIVRKAELKIQVTVQDIYKYHIKSYTGTLVKADERRFIVAIIPTDKIEIKK